MIKYVNPTPVCTGSDGTRNWEYFFAQKASGGEYVMVIRDLRNLARTPCEIGVDHNFVVSHEQGDANARNRAQELAADCIDALV